MHFFRQSFQIWFGAHKAAGTPAFSPDLHPFQLPEASWKVASPLPNGCEIFLDEIIKCGIDDTRARLGIGTIQTPPRVTSSSGVGHTCDGHQAEETRRSDRGPMAAGLAARRRGFTGLAGCCRRTQVDIQSHGLRKHPKVSL